MSKPEIVETRGANQTSELEKLNGMKELAALTERFYAHAVCNLRCEIISNGYAADSHVQETVCYITLALGFHENEHTLGSERAKAM
jgi:hypothetical protein